MTVTPHRDLRQANAALRAALPVLRRSAWEFIASCAFRDDPATLCPEDWASVAPDIKAIRLAESCVGPQLDLSGVDGSWLDAAIKAAPASPEPRA